MSKLNIPNHIGIIMDGNGRWATKKGLSRSKGHLEGSKTLEKLALHANKIGVKYLSVYAFSTDNFKRDINEVNYLMNLFVKNFTKKLNVFLKNNVKVLFSGRKEPLRSDVLETMDNLSKKTENNTGTIFNICLNYGGQEEIIDCFKKLVRDKVNFDDLKREDLYKYMYQDLPPIDLVIRTSGEYRISNFMLYQSSYAEYYFPKILFPDFNENCLDEAILDYNRRDRRFGGVKKWKKEL